MLAPERLEALLDLVAKQQKMSVQELGSALEVSPATLRRDLSGLEAQGKVVRVHGAVVHPTFFRGEASFSQTSRRAAHLKREMARVASDLVPNGATVWVDAGSTCLELGVRLLSRRDLTLLTPSLPLAMRAVEGEEGARVVMLGGEVRAISGATVGALALSWAGHLRADWCFIGASGLSEEDGASTTELGEASLKTAMMARAQTRVLLCDSAKWNKPATVAFASWDAFQVWITGGDFGKSRPHPKGSGPRVIKVASN